MRISCLSVDDFLANLNDALKNGRRPYMDRIFVQRSRAPVNVDKTSWEVGFKATCVLELADDGQAMLDFGALCGKDRETKDGGTEGTDEAKRLLSHISQWAGTNGVTILPGLLEM